jgi:hypothetical protein
MSIILQFIVKVPDVDGSSRRPRTIHVWDATGPS